MNLRSLHMIFCSVKPRMTAF